MTLNNNLVPDAVAIAADAVKQSQEYSNHKRTLTKEQKDIIKTILADKNKELQDSTKYEVLFNQIIKTCYDQHIRKLDILEVTNSINNYEDDKEFYTGLIDEIYNIGFSLDGGWEDLKKHNKSLSDDEKTLLQETIIAKDESEIMVEPTSTDSSIIINNKRKQIIREYSRIVNKKDMSKHYTIIEASPAEVIVYDSPLTDENRSFQIHWTSHLSTRPFITGGEIGGGSVKEIETQLEEAGYCPNPRHLSGAISSVVTAFINNKLAKIKKDVEYPGFFYDDADNKIISIKYRIILPEHDELIEAVELLEALVKHFPKDADAKLATCLKWGWLSPFSYIKKQRGEFLPWLVLDGVAGTGKTVLGHIVLLLWKPINENNDMGGSSFDTVARVGSRISQSTFPILINEPHGTFQNEAVIDMLKSSIERTQARGKYIGSRYKYIPSLAPIMFTTNRNLPNMDAIARRTYKVALHYNERKNSEEKQAFESEFRLNTPIKSRLNKLKAISQFFAHEIINDPSLLDEKWTDCANMILHRLYTDLNLVMPEWLKKYTPNKTLEDNDEDNREDIRIFLINQMNRQKQNIKIYNHDGYEEKEENLYSEELKETNDFTDRIWNIVNERLIPWLILVDRKGEKHICFTQGFKKALYKETGISIDLKSISELLGWEYKLVRLSSKGNPKKVIKVGFKDFLDYLYPDLVVEEVEQ